MEQICVSSKSVKGPKLAQKRHQGSEAFQAVVHEDVQAKVEGLS